MVLVDGGRPRDGRVCARHLANYIARSLLCEESQIRPTTLFSPKRQRAIVRLLGDFAGESSSRLHQRQRTARQPPVHTPQARSGAGRAGCACLWNYLWLTTGEALHQEGFHFNGFLRKSCGRGRLEQSPLHAR